MKDFQENIDETAMRGQTHPFKAPERALSFVQKAGHIISRYSLLIIVGGAALAITFLHFQGRSLWARLTRTPLPQFWLEEAVAEKKVPDKTVVYDQVLEEEKKQLRKKRQAAIVKPSWQGVLQPDTTSAGPLPQSDDSVASLPPKSISDPTRIRRPKAKPRPKKSVLSAKLPAMPSADTASASAKKDFFQPVRADEGPSPKFIRCVVHGDQQVGSSERIALRLEEPIRLDDGFVSAHTLIYGNVQLSQNRLQIQVQRINDKPVLLSVHDHTYHEGILLDDHATVTSDATRRTLYNQGRRSLNRLPGQVATELGRGLLQPRSARGQSVFLPDGFPLYLYHQKPQ